MPRRKYTKRRNNFKRKKWRKKKKRPVSRANVKAIAKQVAQIQIQKMAEPLFCEDPIGSYAADFTPSQTVTLKSGASSPSNWFYREGPLLLPQQLVGDELDLEPNFRKDSNVNVTGMYVYGRLATDSPHAKITVYIGTTYNEPFDVDATYFASPTCLDHLTERHEDARRARRIIWSKTYTLASRYKNEHVQREFHKYLRFKTPIEIKFNGTQNNDWDGKRFFVAMTCYNPQEGTNDHVNMIGNIKYYYRDM